MILYLKYILIFLLLIILINIIYEIIKLIKYINFKYLKNYLICFSNKLNYMLKVKYNLKKISKVFYINSALINSYTIFLFSVIVSILVFFIMFKYTNVIISSLFLSIIFFFVPLTILEIIKKYIDLKIKRSFSLLMINLQTFSKNSNNVILALKEVKSYEPLKKYIDNFNSLVNSGFNVGQAFDNLITEVEDEEISRIIFLLKMNYINGGNLYKFLKESNDYLLEIEKIKQKQYEKQNNVFIILLVIVFINIFLLFCFSFKNEEYKNILLNTFIGKIIIDFNSFIYFLIYFYIRKKFKEW